MNRILALVVGVWLGVVCGCSGKEEWDDLTPDEQRSKVMREGVYCCTHDGASEMPECVGKARAGSVYVLDYNTVDASGRGDACGWILESR